MFGKGKCSCNWLNHLWLQQPQASTQPLLNCLVVVWSSEQLHLFKIMKTMTPEIFYI